MKFWTIVKLLAGLVVAGVVAFTAMLAYHITIEPLGGIFEVLIPEAGSVIRVEKEEEFIKALDAAEIPDFEPGNRAFQKAHELIALGKISEGREKLTAIVNVFPSSPAAPSARRIVGEMNLDEILASNFMEGKIRYEVMRGDSFIAIAQKHQTNLDMLMHLNGLLNFQSLQPGDDLLLLPLNFRLLIDVKRKAVVVWSGAKFVCEYPIETFSGVILGNSKTTIATRQATMNGKKVSHTSADYRSSNKSIQLKSPPIVIFSNSLGDDDTPNGIGLHETDMEELFLLTRAENEVEIRNSQK